MFKGKGEQVESGNNPTGVNNIVEGTKITGDIECNGNFRLGGELVGNLKTKGRLVVGVNGKIVGDVICNEASIEGAIEGNVQVNKEMSIKSTGKMNGVVNAGSYLIESGAVINGEFKTNGGQGIQK